MENGISRVGDCRIGSGSLDNPVGGGGGEHGRFGVRDFEDRSRGRGGIPAVGTGFDDAQLEVGGRGAVPPFREEVGGVGSERVVDIGPAVDETPGRLVQVEVDRGGRERAGGVPREGDGLGGVDGRGGIGEGVKVARGEVASWDESVNGLRLTWKGDEWLASCAICGVVCRVDMRDVYPTERWEIGHHSLAR